MACGCDYSYTCGECQLKIDAENQAQYVAELHEWTLKVITELAKKLNLDVPEPPKKRYYY